MESACQIKKILDTRVGSDGSLYYHVKWEKTWEKADTLSDYPNLLELFWQFVDKLQQAKETSEGFGLEKKPVQLLSNNGDSQRLSISVHKDTDDLLSHTNSCNVSPLTQENERFADKDHGFCSQLDTSQRDSLHSATGDEEYDGDIVYVVPDDAAMRGQYNSSNQIYDAPHLPHRMPEIPSAAEQDLSCKHDYQYETSHKPVPSAECNRAKIFTGRGSLNGEAVSSCNVGEQARGIKSDYDRQNDDTNPLILTKQERDDFYDTNRRTEASATCEAAKVNGKLMAMLENGEVLNWKDYFYQMEVREAHDAKSQKIQYQCKLCCKRITHKRDAPRHFRIHSGAKTNICEICFEGFSRKDHLRTHIRKNHPDSIAS